MKITREQPQFTPITIVIETKDEADFIYGLLSANDGDTLTEHIDKYEDIGYDMFKKLDDVHTS